MSVYNPSPACSITSVGLAPVITLVTLPTMKSPIPVAEAVDVPTSTISSTTNAPEPTPRLLTGT